MRQAEMLASTAPSRGLGARSLFLVWGPPSHGPRSIVFARELGIEAFFLVATRRRGMLAGLYKYPVQAAKTVGLLVRRRPRVVFVQNPPSFAPILVWLYSALTGARFVVDAHSGAMQFRFWTRPRFLYRAMARAAVTTIVTNDRFAATIRGYGGRALVVADIPTTYPAAAAHPVPQGFNVMMVSSFAWDEPLEEVIAAARSMPEVGFFVTGDPARLGDGVPRDIPGNVHLTGFLPEEDYYALMAACDAVLCLTKRDDTMQRGACEAVWVGRPIVTSDWRVLRDTFGAGAAYADNTEEGIRGAILDVARDPGRYAGEIERLRIEHRLAWDRALRSLDALLGDRAGPRGHGGGDAG
jgi:glycosyltransferase involved in cell wall biosynthesis